MLQTHMDIYERKWNQHKQLWFHPEPAQKTQSSSQTGLTAELLKPYQLSGQTTEAHTLM